MITQIINENICMAIIVRQEYSASGITFLNSTSDSLQLGFMKREKGYQIFPHLHNKVKREIFDTQEVLFIKSGKVRADFYDNKRSYLESHILNQGDILLILNGGHSFMIIEEAEIFEVKQGPYIENLDKIKFNPIQEESIKIK